MQKLFSAMDDHAQSIRDDLIQALESPGVQAPTVGSVDLKSINVTTLADLLQFKTQQSWTKDVDSLFMLAELIYSVRNAFIRQDWDVISSLLEEIISFTSSGNIINIPDICRYEIQTIRYEVENRYIISSLSSKLVQGRLHVVGSVLSSSTKEITSSPSRPSNKQTRASFINDDYLESGEVNIYDISYTELLNCLEACKVIQPRTPEASRLVYTAQIIVWFRKNILSTDSDPQIWYEVYDKVSSYLSADSLFMISPISYPELKLILNTSKDNIVCEKLEASLGIGNVIGQPGELDISSISIADIQDSLSYADNVITKTERSRGLIYYCRTVKQLREYLIQASHNISYWKKIREFLYKFQSSAPIIRSTSSSWIRCREEIILISHSAEVYEIREMLETSCRDAMIVYLSRSSISIDDTHDRSSYNNILSQPSSKQSSSSKSTSISDLTSRFHNLSFPIYDLERLLEQAATLSYACNTLEGYISCSKQLIKLRQALNTSDFHIIESCLIHPVGHRNHDHDDILSMLEVTQKESKLIIKEYYNLHSIYELQQVLYPIDDSIYHEHRLRSMKRVIDQVDTYHITCLASQQLLACAKYVFLLRQGIFIQDSDIIADALQWFEHHAYRCPDDIINEVKDSFKRHQNDLLATGLKHAFQVGKLTMISDTGAMNYDDVDVTELHHLMNEAMDVFDRTDEVQALLSAADIIYHIRSSQKERNTVSLKNFLASLTRREYIHPMILDEIAMARSEVDNEIAVGALLDAIHAFDDEDAKPLAFIPASIQHFPSSSSTSSLAIAKKRRYSYQNAMDDHDIDVDSINLDILDEAMSIAKDHGLLSSEAKCLYRTVALLRLLREAMKRSDWNKVEDILYSAKHRLDHHHHDIHHSNSNNKHHDMTTMHDYDDIHPAASRELAAVEKQVEMRSAIIDISKALKSGGAKCSNGIVDTSTVNIKELDAAIIRSEESFSQLLSPTSSSTDNIIISADDVGKDMMTGTYSTKKSSSSASSSASTSPMAIESKSSYGRRTPSILSIDSTIKQQFTSSSSSMKHDKPRVIDFTSIQNQTHLLIESAKIIVKIRELLLLGEIERAGSMADEYLTIGYPSHQLDGHQHDITGEDHHQLHVAVRAELHIYAKEISKSLNLMKLCASMREGILSGNVDILAALLLEVAESDSINRFSYDLGLMRVLYRANHILCLWKTCHLRLIHASSCYDINELRSVLLEADRLNLRGEVYNAVSERARKIDEFELFLISLAKSAGGIFTQQPALLKLVVDFAEYLGLEKHPVCLRAVTMMRLSPSAIRIVSICEGIQQQRCYPIASETIRLKRSYLSLDSSRDRYRLERYTGLRDPMDFELLHRHPLVNKPNHILSQQMLSYSVNQIPTSLTTLHHRPEYAAVAVWTFTHVIRGIERNLFSSPEVQLKSLLTLGRLVPIMRDEIMLQIIKQIRGNKDNNMMNKLLKLLCTCLYHFPPTQLFENYLESYLISETEATGMGLIAAQAASYRSAIAKQCIRFMHESIISYGYVDPIHTMWDASLCRLRLWLHDGSSSRLPGYEILPSLPVLPDSIHLPSSIISSTMTSSGSSSSSSSAMNNTSTSSLHDYLLSDIAFSPSESTSSSTTTASSIPRTPSSDAINHASASSLFVASSRCTRDDWNKRFSYFASSYLTARKSKAPATLVIDEFATSLADQKTPVEPFDKALLLYLIYGYDMDLKHKYWNQIVREMYADHELLHYRNPLEETGSKQRIAWLKDHIIVPKPSGDIAFEDISFDDVYEEAKLFWIKYIEKLADTASSCQPELKWNVTAELIKTKIKMGNHEVTLPSFELPATSSWGDNSHKAEINWELYHDLVITAMMIFIESRQDMIYQDMDPEFSMSNIQD